MAIAPWRRARSLIAPLLVALALLAAAGCGGSGDQVASTGGPDGGGRFPLTVEHALGTTTIPAPPGRVVALGVSDADVALALGVVPVGIHSRYGFDSGVGPWAEGRLDELAGDRRPAVWKGPQLNFEAIASARPDLILYVAEGGDRQVYETLSGIAPTVGLPTGEVPYGPSWPAATRLIARSLGRAAEGERLVERTERYLAGVRRANPSFAGRTVTYLDVFGSDVYFGGERSTVIDLMLQLGFRTVPAVREADASETQHPISAELLPRIDADALLIYGFGRPGSEVLAANPRLAGLGAVRAGRAWFLRDLSLSAPSVLSIPYGLDALIPFLRRATGA